MDPSVANYRKYARQCLELAVEVAAKPDHRMLLALAETWLKLAELTRRESEWTSAT
jgi:hypothetical protein